jgi:hypothetical protein
MMSFELGLEELDPKRARNTALTIAMSKINFASIRAKCPGERNLEEHVALLEEHVAILVDSRRFGLFRRKDDFLAEGVAAVFGLAEGEAELLALCFHGERFTPADAANWLAERGFTPLLFIPITGTDCPPCV